MTTAGSTGSRCLLAGAAPAHAIALAFGGEHDGVVREAIEQRGRQLFVAGKDGDPFGEGEIRGDDRGAPLGKWTSTPLRK